MAKENDDVEDRELTTRLLKPPEFPPSVPATDIADFNQRDQKLLLGFYVIAQKVDWLVQCTLEANLQQREFERELIKAKRWRKWVMTRMALASGIAVFVVTTFASGFIGQLASAFVKRFFP